MKRKVALYGALSALAVTGILGVNFASAHGFGGFGMFGGGSALTPDQIAERHQAMFENQAKILGVSVDAVKSGWADGKSLLDIAKESGITETQLAEKMQAARLGEMESHMKTLVEKGVITQAQADKRLKFMESNQGKMTGGGGHMKMMRGFGF
ncbi:MAG: hypothetical protein UY56_C0004G0021 [Parcubacteria group bacterium GW2011_GWA1_50_14]|nr:MAG: hypothetical protein UY56_C0004G0021 [Parcubacteria group bacterium GW2011_GWA1_50_14]